MGNLLFANFEFYFGGLESLIYVIMIFFITNSDKCDKTRMASNANTARLVLNHGKLSHTKT